MIHEDLIWIDTPDEDGNSFIEAVSFHVNSKTKESFRWRVTPVIIENKVRWSVDESDLITANNQEPPFRREEAAKDFCQRRENELIEKLQRGET